MGKRYQSRQPSTAFTVWGRSNIEIVRFVSGEYPQPGTPDLEDEILINAIESHPEFNINFFEKDQMPDRFGITPRRRAEIMASARAVLAHQEPTVEPVPEPEQTDETGRPTIPSSSEIAQMKKEDVVGLMASLGIEHDPNQRVLVLKTQLREWIAAKSS